MRVWFRREMIGRGLIWLACLVLAGCAERTITPADALAQLSSGRPLLSCRELCLAEWHRAQPQAAQLDAGGRSQDLAVLVIRVGYQDDLSLYYLGRAAEGMGYRLAAASYYRQSMQLSGTSISCQYLSRQCGGVALPRAAAARVAAIERALNPPPRSRRTGAAPPAPGAPEMPESAPAEAGEPEPSLVSSPAPVPVPVAVPSPVPRPSGPAPFEYIEPPPAAR